jgi:hypothetical protein
MRPTVHGYRVKFQVDTHHDTMVVPSLGVEDEEQACSIVILAARHGYPVGLINITHIDLGRWVPQGNWANPEHTALYID